MRTAGQGVDAVMALIDINIGEVRLQMAVAMPAAPVWLAVAGSKWACDRIGPVAFGAILVAVATGGIWWYTRQPEERREQIEDAVGTVGKFYMENYAVAEAVSEARAPCAAPSCPGPPSAARRRRSCGSWLWRRSRCPPSRSPDQLPQSVRPRVTDLRAYLRAHDAMFGQVRRGGYELGLRHQLERPLAEQVPSPRPERPPG